MMDHLKVFVTNPLLYVPLGPCEVIVSNKHLDTIKTSQTKLLGKYDRNADLVSIHHQSIHQMRANKSCSPSYKDPLLVLVGSEFHLGVGSPLSQFTFHLLKLGFQDSNGLVCLFKLSCITIPS